MRLLIPFFRKHSGIRCHLKSFIMLLVQSEIDERRKFLEDMEALGQSGKYRSIIATEISQVCVGYNTHLKTF